MGPWDIIGWAIIYLVVGVAGLFAIGFALFAVTFPFIALGEHLETKRRDRAWKAKQAIKGTRPCANVGLESTEERPSICLDPDRCPNVGPSHWDNATGKGRLYHHLACNCRRCLEHFLSITSGD